jgi:hypothetical protein
MNRGSQWKMRGTGLGYLNSDLRKDGILTFTVTWRFSKRSQAQEVKDREISLRWKAI